MLVEKADATCEASSQNETDKMYGRHEKGKTIAKGIECEGVGQEVIKVLVAESTGDQGPRADSFIARPQSEVLL